MKIEEISSLEAFCAVAKHGNFTKAAAALKVALPILSKRVAKLEDKLGVRLFQRSTRVVSLTGEGRALWPKAVALLEDWQGFENLFEDKQKLVGTLKITCVPFVAKKLLFPVMEKFVSLHPGIQIELDLSESFLNLIESNFDIGIRIQDPTDTDLIYRKLVPNDLVLCASPAYLKANGTPTNLKQLMDHSMLILEIHKNCRFKNSTQKLKPFMSVQRIRCNNGAFQTEMALKGSGILVRSIWDVQEYLKSGALVQVLKKHPLETFGHIHAVIPSRRLLAPRVRQFLELVEQEATRWKIDV